MKVFISWSGERSKAIADAFHWWLPTIISQIEPWMSEHNIEKGTRSMQKLAVELDGNYFGLLCLTPENLTSPWLLFEAGALSKDAEESRAWTVLYELKNTDITGPLSQFQHTRLEKGEIKKLMRAMNVAGGAPLVKESLLDVAFERGWGELESRIATIPTPSSSRESGRSTDDMIREALGLLRDQTRLMNSAFFQTDLARVADHLEALAARTTMELPFPEGRMNFGAALKLRRPTKWDSGAADSASTSSNLAKAIQKRMHENDVVVIKGIGKGIVLGLSDDTFLVRINEGDSDVRDVEYSYGDISVLPAALVEQISMDLSEPKKGKISA